MIMMTLALSAAGLAAAGPDDDLREALDILESMETTRITVDYQRTPLEDVLAELGLALGHDIRADWDEVARYGMDSGSPVTLRAHARDVRDVLTGVTAQFGDMFGRPVFDVHAGRVIITAPEALTPAMLPAVYDVRDLLASDAATAHIDRMLWPEPETPPAQRTDTPTTEDDATPPADEPPAPPEPEPDAAPPPAGPNDRPPDEPDPDPDRVRGGDEPSGFEPLPPGHAPHTLPDPLDHMRHGELDRDRDAGRSIDPQRPLRPEELIALLMQHVDPNAWLDLGGGSARISAYRGTVVVTATPTVHQALRRLLDQLRAAHPASVRLSAAVIDLPEGALRQLERRYHPMSRDLATALLNRADATVLWRTDAAVALDDAFTAESAAGTASIALHVTPAREADTGRLTLELDAAIDLPPHGRQRVKTIIALSNGDAAAILRMPPLPRSDAAPDAPPASVRLVVLIPTALPS